MLTLKGNQGKTIVADGSSVKIIKTHWLMATREKTFPIRNISSVEVKKPGIMAGYIQLSIAGGAVRDSSFKITGGAFDAASDENSVLFTGDKAFKIALEIKQHIESFKDGPTATQAVSAADEILKLKALLDQGILTADEFNAKKKQLLGI